MAVQIDGSTGKVTGTQSDWSGNVSIGGTLTYEDVTNIDAVGLITARTGIEIGAKPGVGASISADGNMIVSGISTISNLYVPDKIIHDGDTNTAIRFPSADNISFETSGTERLRISDSGGESHVLITGSVAPSGTGATLMLKNLNTTANAINTIQGVDASGQTTSAINFYNTSDGTNEGYLSIFTRPASGSLTEGLRVQSDGTIEILDKLEHFSDADTNIRFPSNDTIAAETGGSERLRVTSAGLVLISHSTSHSDMYSKLQVCDTSSSGSIDLGRYTANAHPPYLNFFKSRSGTINGNTVIQDGDKLGYITFSGNDGSGFHEASSIYGAVDGTPGDNDMPGRIVFSTVPDGSTTSADRMTIKSDGKVAIGNASPQQLLHVWPDTANTTSAYVRVTSGDRGSGTGIDLGSDADGDGRLNVVSNANLKLYTNNTERLRIGSTGTVEIKANANGFGSLQFQDNNIGGHRLEVADEAMSSAIYLPRAGQWVLITGYSNPDAYGMNYPQPDASGMFYCDMGPSRRIDQAAMGGDLGSSWSVKGAYTGTVSNCDDNKFSIMSGDVQGTFRIVNRFGDKYLFNCTYL